MVNVDLEFFYNQEEFNEKVDSQKHAIIFGNSNILFYLFDIMYICLLYNIYFFNDKCDLKTEFIIHANAVL